MQKARVYFQNRFVLAFVIFLVLILVGTSGYHWLEGMSFIDALYMTVITISTVGFGGGVRTAVNRPCYSCEAPHGAFFFVNLRVLRVKKTLCAPCSLW